MTDEEQKLIELIRRAFAGVRLEDGVSLNMTEYADSGGSCPAFKERARDDEREDWTAIPDETLEQFTVTFSFTDHKGFRFYIPAYMIWTIRNHATSNSIIGPFSTWAIDPDHYLFDRIPFTQWFTPDQVNAMVSFLEWVIKDGEREGIDGDAVDDTVRQNLAKIRRAQENG